MCSQFLSIVIPSYNSCQNLKNIIEELLCHNDLQLFEIIVIDGKSEDDSLLILQKYKEHITFLSESDNGIYHAMNKGIHLAKNEWILFLGTDDKLNSDLDLKKLAIRLNSYTRNIIAVCGNIVYDTGEKFISYINKDLFFKNTIHHQSAFYRREELINSGGFSSTFKILGDFDLNQRLFIKKKKINNKVIFINELIAICGSQGVSKKAKWRMRWERLSLIKSFPLYIKHKINTGFLNT